MAGRVLIVGAAGGVGSEVARLALASGREVVATVLNSREAEMLRSAARYSQLGMGAGEGVAGWKVGRDCWTCSGFSNQLFQPSVSSSQAHWASRGKMRRVSLRFSVKPGM